MSEIDCQRVLSLLEAYCDREVSGADAAVVERHLVRCIPCLARRDFRLRLKAVVRARCGGAPDLPSGLAERVRAVLGQAS
ncbi:MAG TPA: zf-HC2 domain-containing protein [Actinomycetota bacterium]|nr:zf-HC2 domain-containing protein [Actinomycetota bacterium]